MSKAPAAKKKSVPAKKPAAAKTAPAKKPAVKKVATPTAKKSVSAFEQQCKIISAALEDNKAEDIVELNISDKCSFADRMFVASGRAQRHVAALADHVANALKKIGVQPMSIEGKDSGDWVLIDVGNVIVHIFRPEVRQFYNIEKMWALPAPTA